VQRKGWQDEQAQDVQVQDVQVQVAALPSGEKEQTRSDVQEPSTSVERVQTYRVQDD
jgi:hypothetical protein